MSPILETNLFFPLIALSLLYLIISKLTTSSKKGSPLPPGPRPWPIVGNIFQLGKSPVHISLANLAQVHGPLMLVKFGTRPIIVGSSPAAAREILQIHDRALSGRHVSNPLQIKGSKIHNLALAFVDSCHDHFKRLKSVYKGELFSSKILDAQTEVRENKIMGDLVDFEGKGIGEGLVENIRKYSALGGIPQLADMFPILSGWDLQRYYKKLMDVFEKVCGIWADLIKEQREQRNDGRRDFAKALVESGFSHNQINAVLMEVFSAGIESTSATIEWALTELLRNPKAMQNLRQEFAKEINGDIIRETDLSRLPYLEACLKETLRLHPPGPLLLPHRAMETCEMMGYTIPKDSQILVNMWAIARDPKIWDDPLKFKPERFLSSGLDYMGANFAFIPFGSGRRFCMGQPLVSRVVPHILASLVYYFEWTLPGNLDPTLIDMTDKFDVTMLKEQRLCVIPKLRRPFIN
ncbi:(S)-N-methylcoclaurine 3'-hydroxylase [Actinidia chinensis var. chinensis]|uniref:(S)-N-methylcoclaurine 3'-hydroxylase n=1 Tax=Actinidia chinensis var. chinensis TaxID=1590841 RepID=A0A2R6PM66_ACTCC|nr:(S)-N-methylcoclaurine 3'-hydroxylase [Actinidia chinensis var. chinensis]